MKPNLIAIPCIVLLMVSPGDQYRSGRSLFEKRIEDVYWESTTSCQLSHHCLNRRVRSWIVSSGQKARETCKLTFQFDRWGCRVESSTFNKVSRESAALYALLSSSLVHQAATIIARMGSVGRHLTHLGGLESTNFMELSLEMTRRYLAIPTLSKSEGGIHAYARKHNALFGLEVVNQSISKKCKCHGFSGSCSLKTCWDTLPQFSQVAERLRQKYLLVVRVKQENRPRRSLVPSKDTISVLDESEDFCSQMTGRRCQDANHCKKFCCDQGFFNETGIKYYYCNCNWFYNYELKCKICKRKLDNHFCK